MEQLFAVENIKCGGCENTIIKALKKIPLVEDVAINIETGTIKITSAGERQLILDKNLVILNLEITPLFLKQNRTLAAQ